MNDYLVSPKGIPRQFEGQDWRELLVRTAYSDLLSDFVTIDYPGSPILRTISEPGIFAGRHDYYLRGFCLYRNGERLFSVSQINKVIMPDGEVFSSGIDWINALEARLGAASP